MHSCIFHNHITGVPQALSDPTPRAQECLHMQAEGWSGVVILSEGYDIGEAAVLAGKLARLRRRARRVAWLNSLMNQPGCEPVSQGMGAALPHLDLRVPAGVRSSLKVVLPGLVESWR